MNINERVGRRIKVRRVELGMTQAELAQKLSVGQSNLSYIERGEGECPHDELAGADRTGVELQAGAFPAGIPRPGLRPARAKAHGPVKDR